MIQKEMYEEIQLAKESNWSERFNELTELFYQTYGIGYLQYEEQLNEQTHMFKLTNGHARYIKAESYEVAKQKLMEKYNLKNHTEYALKLTYIGTTI